MAIGLHTSCIKTPKRIWTNCDTRSFSNFDSLQIQTMCFRTGVPSLTMISLPYRYGQRFRRVRFVNERFKASFLPIWHMADINNHFVSDCTREVRTEGSRGKCACFTPNPFSITGTVSVRHVSVCVPGVLFIYISLRRWRSTLSDSYSLN